MPVGCCAEATLTTTTQQKNSARQIRLISRSLSSSAGIPDTSFRRRRALRYPEGCTSWGSRREMDSRRAGDAVSNPWADLLQRQIHTDTAQSAGADPEPSSLFV